MSFKDISYLELWWPFCSAERNQLCNFRRRHQEEKFCEIVLNLHQWFKEMSFKDISYLELWRPFCSAERNPMCKFGRGYYEEQFCEIILNFGQWFRRRCILKIFLIWSSGSPFVQWSRTICAILIEGIMRNNSVKLFWIWTSGSGGDAF